MVDAAQINFEAPATLRKWPSLNGRRRDDREPYILADGTLESCIRQFMQKPASTRQLYDVLTTAQPPSVLPIMDEEHIIELAKFAEKHAE